MLQTLNESMLARLHAGPLDFLWIGLSQSSLWIYIHLVTLLVTSCNIAIHDGDSDGDGDAGIMLLLAWPVDVYRTQS